MTAFPQSTLEALKQLATSGPAGNRWFKVNLHVHGQGNDPAEIVSRARASNIDLIAITDHQAFKWIDPVAEAAGTPGRQLTVLPGIEITANEGCHLLGVFPQTFRGDDRTLFLGWLEILGTGDTRTASRKDCLQVLEKVNGLGGVIIMPHPYSAGIGALDSARKMSTKMEWLESGHIRLVQIEEDRVKYIERDEDGNFHNRFVIASSPPNVIRTSRYCLAPFNRSDAHRADEVDIGCSWFRMGELTVEGLKQVACEPFTRISRAEPATASKDYILGVRVAGGYCDGQFFKFSDALSCVVGQNHAGKSSVFDFVRYGLGHNQQADKQSSQKLLKRLNDILKPGGSVEVYVQSGGCLFVVKRCFNPTFTGREPQLDIDCKHDRPLAYKLDQQAGNLVPVQDFTFGIEVYEQGRIGRLREDLSRQLEMLDEFANIGKLVADRNDVVRRLGESAKTLKPLYEKREGLRSDVGELAELETEVAEKQKYLPDETEEQHWAASTAMVDAMEQIVADLTGVVARIPAPESALHELSDDLQLLFGQRCVDLDANATEESDLLTEWRKNVESALAQIAAAREMIISAVNGLASASSGPRGKWTTARQAHERSVSDHVGKAGYDSPKELIDRLKRLRKDVLAIKKTKQPLLSQTDQAISNEEVAREALLGHLTRLNTEISEKRREKSRGLTAALDGQMKIGVTDVDRTSYQQVLQELCSKVASQRHNIKDREGQLGKVIGHLLPLDLAKTLRARGKVRREDGTESTLEALCGITLNTQNVLCSIADDIDLLNRLETVVVPDVPEILVKRWGETAYANLRTGLSPGEQSAAILMLALQTRTMPLILDQPEEDLGYNFVVHLVVPKMLKAKFLRQLLVVTLQANIPVLGDADVVLKMENKPAGTSRQCVAAAMGCFESPEITAALLELEGGVRAFQFRQHRYRLAFPGQ